MEDKLQKILDKVKEERILKRVGQKEIAAFMDIDVRTYNQIENGKSNLSLQQLLSIAAFFKRDISYFISSDQSNHIESSPNSGVFYDTSSQNNYNSEAIAAYKLLVKNLQEEVKRLNSQV
ncbi:MAG: helix-turn-helix transcriptional regulator [Chitinophagales bacterium]|nr:helix-turn-helix transcriptional regulator [Chitinophagales bacterium]